MALSVLVSIFLPSSLLGQLLIDNARVISEKRTGRTEFEYTLVADLTNTGPAIQGITANLSVTSTATTGVVDGALNFGPVPSGATVTSTDTFAIVQDRAVPFDPASLQWTFATQPSAPTIVQPPSPTRLTTIAVFGTARPNAVVEITGGTSTATATANASGIYTANVALQLNRVNKLFVSAIGDTSERSAPSAADVIQDTQAPSLFVDFPATLPDLTNESITVAGRVGDMLSGFSGLTVTVNGLPANVIVGNGNNGTFERANVPLTISATPNLITVVASDVNGNSVTKQVSVKRVALTGARMLVSSGDMQRGTIHTPLGAPIVVQVLNASGTPFAGKLVTFNVTRSDGRLKSAFFGGPPGTMMFQTHTDADGLATAYWTLGGDAGCANNRIAVTSRDIAGTIFFSASAGVGPLSQINIGAGNNQQAETNAPAPEPLRAWVSDSCNGIAGALVTFTVTQGGGKVNGRNSITLPSDRTGHVQVAYTVGPETGNQLVEASFAGNTGSPATFIIFGIQRDPAKPTSFTGLVLDNTSQPIGGAYCSLTVGGATLTTTSDLQGRFAFTNAPAGHADFFVSGATATSLGGNSVPINSFPFLTFTPTLIPNAENTLPKPVLLPQLNPANNVTYNGITDLVLTCQGMEGLKMTIKANSMRKADGSLVTPSNTAVVSLNQVHHDDVPMPIPDGAAPPFTWTLQPARATFNPPIQIEYPNMTALPAGAVAYFLSFNHDTERFEIVASGHVTNDGSTIVTDAGGGLSIAGWGCNCPPYSVTGDCDDCDNEASPEAATIADANQCDPCKNAAAKKLKLRGVAAGFLLLPPFSGYAANHLNKFLDATGSDNFYGNNSAPVNDIQGHPNFISKNQALVQLVQQVVGSVGNGSGNLSFTRQIGGICFYDGGFPKNQLAAGVGCLSEGYQAEVTAAFANGRITGSIHYTMRDHYNFDATDCGKSSFDGAACCLQKAGEAKGFFNHFTFDSPLAVNTLPASPLRLEAQPLKLAGNEPNEVLDHVDPSPLSQLGPILDSSMRLEVNGQVERPNKKGDFVVHNISAPDQFGAGGPGSSPDFISDDFVRLLAVGEQGGQNIYAFSDFFQIRQRKVVTVSDLIFTDTPPKKPQSLRLTSPLSALTSVGQTVQLQTVAVYPDSTTANVSRASMWTTYRTSNTAVVTVAGDGLVTARGSGVAFLTAGNEGATAVVRVIVALGDPLTRVEGFARDANGSPVAGAIVSVTGQSLSRTTNALGFFSISGVLTTLGDISVRVVAGNLTSVTPRIPPVPGGITDAGISVLIPGQNEGREFIVAFQPNFDNTTVTLSLFISSEVLTAGTVEIPGIGYTADFSVEPGVAREVVLPVAALTVGSDVIVNRGIHITADRPISVYGLNRKQFTTDAFTALPVETFGTRYRVMSHGDLGGANNRSQFAVVAEEANTTLTIVPTAATTGHPAGQALSVTLNRFEVYQLRTSTSGADLTGTLITSDKPVGLFSGHSCANLPNPTTGFCDHLCEQIPPTDTWGQIVLTVPLSTRLNGDTFRILADQTDTDVTITGGSPGSFRLQPGGFSQRTLVASNVISANKPILVAQYSNGTQFDGVVSDPFMMLIPPAEQFLPAYIFSTPGSGFTTNFVNIVARAADGSGGLVLLDGTPVNASAFSPLQTSGFVFARVPIGVGTHSVKAPNPAGIYVYGFATDDSYGYPGGFALQRRVAGQAFGALPVASAESAQDSDGDGLPDAYELALGLNPVSAADGMADSDGDGFTNGEEYRAGTNPKDAASVFRILAIERAANAGVALTFSSVIGKRYLLQCAEELTGAWSVISEPIAGTGGPVTLTDQPATGLKKCFYRVGLVP